MLLYVTLIMLVVISCDKNDDTSPSVIYQEETPLPGFLDASGFNADVNTASSAAYQECGLSFKPLEYGTINAITIKLPVNPSRIRVTIWDKATGSLLVTARIPLILDYVSGTTYEVAITPFALTKNKEYVISMSTQNWTTRQRIGATDANYPITVGNVQFINFVSNLGQDLIMPSNINLSYVAGDLGFKFKRI